MKFKSLFLVLTAIFVIFLLQAWNSSSPVSAKPVLGLTLTPTEEATPQPSETPLPTAAPTFTPVSPQITPTPTVLLPTAQPTDDPGTDPIVELPKAGFAPSRVQVSFLPLPFGPARADATLPAALVEDDLMQRIVIPYLKVDAAVRPVAFNGKEWDVAAIQDEVAWLSESALPGMAGNTVLTAHVTLDNFKHVPLFANLRWLPLGAVVRIETAHAIYEYHVRDQVVVRSDDLSVLRPSAAPQLTLLTCTNWNTATQRYDSRRVVFADLASVIEKPNIVAPRYSPAAQRIPALPR